MEKIQELLDREWEIFGLVLDFLDVASIVLGVISVVCSATVIIFLLL